MPLLPCEDRVSDMQPERGPDQPGSQTSDLQPPEL